MSYRLDRYPAHFGSTAEIAAASARMTQSGNVNDAERDVIEAAIAWADARANLFRSTEADVDAYYAVAGPLGDAVDRLRAVSQSSVT